MKTIKKTLIIWRLSLYAIPFFIESRKRISEILRFNWLITRNHLDRAWPMHPPTCSLFHLTSDVPPTLSLENSFFFHPIPLSSHNPTANLSCFGGANAKGQRAICETQVLCCCYKSLPVHCEVPIHYRCHHPFFYNSALMVGGGSQRFKLTASLQGQSKEWKLPLRYKGYLRAVRDPDHHRTLL